MPKSNKNLPTRSKIGLALILAPFSKNELPRWSSGSNNIILRYYARKVHHNFSAIVGTNDGKAIFSNSLTHRIFFSELIVGKRIKGI